MDRLRLDLEHVGKRESDVTRVPSVLLTVLSDTDHHGIEILLPGPALVVRSRRREDGGTP